MKTRRIFSANKSTRKIQNALVSAVALIVALVGFAAAAVKGFLFKFSFTLLFDFADLYFFVYNQEAAELGLTATAS